MTRTPDPVLQAAVREHLLHEVAAHRDRSRSRGADGRSKPWLRLTVAGLVAAATVATSAYAIQLVDHMRHRPGPAQQTVPTSEPTRSSGADDLRGLITTATGTLTGAAAGTVYLTSTPTGDFRIEIDTTRVSGLQIRHVELATSLTDVDCETANDTADGRVIDFGDADVSKPDALHRPSIGRNDHGDLSYMRVLVLTPNDGSDNDDYCTPSKMGVAELTWTRPARFTTIRAIDHGAGPAAEGTVHLRNGEPESYDVAPDDQLTSVAARFGLTADELLYLNPRRQHGDDRQLYYDETLNLDTDNR